MFVLWPKVEGKFLEDEDHFPNYIYSMTSDSDTSPRHCFGFNFVFTQSFESGPVLVLSIISSFAINHMSTEL